MLDQGVWILSCRNLEVKRVVFVLFYKDHFESSMEAELVWSGEGMVTGLVSRCCSK